MIILDNVEPSPHDAPQNDAIKNATYEGRESTMIERRHRDQEDKDATLALMASLEPFRAANPTMTLQQLASFLFVAKDEGKQVSSYAREAGLAQGVMTRNLFDLGEFNRRREPGLGLVEQRPDLNDRRAHLTYLTHKGRAVVGAYRRALEAYCAKRHK